MRLVIILIIALVLRVVSLATIPPSLDWDEASLGYNAYSILLTGKDEYGSFLPLTLKSFGDYKPAVYSYLDIPFIAVLGLNELAVRLPSALAGVGLCLVVYLLILELKPIERSEEDNKLLALLCGFAVAVSPLSIQFSRVAFESNVAVFFNAAMLLFLLKAIKGRKLYWVSAFICIGLSVFTYQSSRLFVPLFLVGFYWLYHSKVRKLHWFKFFVALLCLLGLGILYTIFFLHQGDRLEVTNYFSYRRSMDTITQLSLDSSLDINTWQFQLIHGEWFAYVRGLFERYLIYFSPVTLFISGDPSPRHHVPDLGTLLYLSILLLPLGVGTIWTKKRARIIFIWLLLAPLPGVLSRDLLTMIRSLNIVVPLSIFEGAGGYWILQTFKPTKYYKVIVSILVILFLANFGIYLDRYFVHFPQEYSQGWVYGDKQAVAQIVQLSNQKKYNQIVFSDDNGQPYIYYLFYTKYDPAKFQQQALLDQSSRDVGTVRKIDGIQFRHIYWPEDRGLKNTLFIGTDMELPDQDLTQAHKIGAIRYLDGQLDYKIVETP